MLNFLIRLASLVPLSMLLCIVLPTMVIEILFSGDSELTKIVFGVPLEFFKKNLRWHGL